MRTILAALLLALSATAAMAQGWDRYDNDRFGYSVDLPPGYEAVDPPPANGDGMIFALSDDSQFMRVYGGNIVEGDFETALRSAMDGATEAGWDLSYKRVADDWASFSGTRGADILYARAIALCGGTQFASFEIEYPAADLEPMNAVVERLVRSLKGTGNGIGC